MDAHDFITSGDHQELIKVLASAGCKDCGGTGERSDADLGDIFHRTWVCPACEGKGWNRQAVQEIIAAAPAR